jgi:hypothetical protein
MSRYRMRCTSPRNIHCMPFWYTRCASAGWDVRRNVRQSTTGNIGKHTFGRRKKYAIRCQIETGSFTWRRSYT